MRENLSCSFAHPFVVQRLDRSSQDAHTHAVSRASLRRQRFYDATGLFVLGVNGALDFSCDSLLLDTVGTRFATRPPSPEFSTASPRSPAESHLAVSMDCRTVVQLACDTLFGQQLDQSKPHRRSPSGYLDTRTNRVCVAYGTLSTITYVCRKWASGSTSGRSST